MRRSPLGVLLAGVCSLSSPAAATDRLDVDQAIFLIEYLGADYAHAVAAGAVTNEGEYAEVGRFAASVAAQADALMAQGASPETVAAVQSLAGMVASRAAATMLRETADATAQHLRREITTTAAPTRPPDRQHGAQLFADACAPCHGDTGRGDGHLASGLLPAPTSFRDADMLDVSPHHIFTAVRYGIEGTAMPSFDAACTVDDAWDIAFHVATLRDGFTPRPTDPQLTVDLRTLAHSSSHTLLQQLRTQRADATLADVDYLRAQSGPPTVSPAVDASTAVASANVAAQLENTFAEIGDRVLPSVVGVSAFTRHTDAKSPTKTAPSGGQWTVASAEDDLYPGFRRTRSASGFVVSADGDILTCSDVLLDRAGKPVDVVAIEYRDGQHLLARVIGIEPTIHLGVVRPEVLPARGLPAIPPVTIGDSDRVRPGHWTIGLGDPAGPSTAFGVGVLSSEPTRQCYQENLTSTLIQSSMQIHPEALGGPMTNIRGEVVALLVPPPGGLPLAGAAPATFALPMNVAIGIYQSLKLKESHVSPWLGFAVLELAAARRRLQTNGDPRPLPPTGVFIDDLFTPSPAAAVDVRVGDCLVALDGHRLLSVLDFQQGLYLAGVGRRMTLELVRDGQTLTKPVTVAARPANATTR